MTIFITVEFNDQLAATNQPVATLDTGVAIVNNEVGFDNTIQAYVWEETSRLVAYCQHGPAAEKPQYLNIDTLVEDYRI